ncbi:hypothetical protein Psta_1746 [Pirellula staleyi DSM 6068]|uniref:Colicin V production protein n=1 Tax=Pirellula staleyi (strain ATCC 27377 / DSM 6068 / ICPB 4128) TaxID=530564 RepID=D2QYW6_PIRSD|nr:hypothetical protein [Pirellula staleyi]ADB16421.1 hypothetical protein Psta_1746 [Pirellula staleyi DSM 6068]
MLFGFLLLVFLGTGVAIWFQGLWNAAITLVNLLLAMLVASNYWEPLTTLIEGLAGQGYTYLLDVVVLWILFAVTFGILRTITDTLSKKPIKFMMPVEMGGRSVLAIWCGWLMLCFVTFSMQMAPLAQVEPLGAWASPSTSSFIGMNPDRMWLGFLQSRSRGALSRGNFSGTRHPEDVDLDVETFDPNSEFLMKYRHRRERNASFEGVLAQ